MNTSGAGVSKGLLKAMMPVPDPHPDVFDVEWPLRVADVNREGRLKFDAATRHIQDIGSDQLREMGFEETHPLWIVRRTMIDLIRPIEFKDMLRLRRWCSGTSNRWCEMRVRIDGRKGGLMESEAFWININRETQGPARISDDFIAGLQRTEELFVPVTHDLTGAGWVIEPNGMANLMRNRVAQVVGLEVAVEADLPPPRRVEANEGLGDRLDPLG